MIKKHLITCSVMLVLLFITKVFIGAKTEAKPYTRSEPTDFDKYHVEDEHAPVLNFADEKLPVGDERVNWKMTSSLRKHHFNHLQTKKLHYRAEHWFPVIEPILEEFGIPADFKYIPLVETGMKKGQTSNRGAAGFWQFMPHTARAYGLRVGRSRDDRFSVEKSTIAACRYFQDLYRQFNSWTLVAAAYNAGAGRIDQQIDRQNEDNYFRMHLNRETGSYVYKLIAMKEIIEKPSEYGYRPKNLDDAMQQQPQPDPDTAYSVTLPSFLKPVVVQNRAMLTQL